MNYKLIVLIIIYTITTSCKTGVEVTFTNESKEDFKTLTIGIFDEQFDFENLKSGQTTKTIKVERIYPYCYARAVTKNDTVRCVPIDFIGEKLKKRGKLNMKIYIDSTSNKKRRLYFITDKKKQKNY
ncbi:MAG: hypothetical protein KDC78_11200 [Aequorivita sp.]|nr:hypothetical protein [Aequorivita sp.]